MEEDAYYGMSPDRIAALSRGRYTYLLSGMKDIIEAVEIRDAHVCALVWRGVRERVSVWR
jgi:hypothetical protein